MEGDQVPQLQNVLHELNASRISLRKSSDEINKALRAVGDGFDLPKIRTLSQRVVDELDAVDLLFELLRIELNPSGIEFAPRQEINIHGIYHRAFAHFEARIANKKLRYSLEKTTSFIVSALPSLIIVPMTLVDNATKYAPHGTVIDVAFDEAKRVATIESLGPEILEDEIGKIFEADFRGRNAKIAEKAGQGRGLYIAKNILDAHGFSISVNQRKAFRVGNVQHSFVSFKVVFQERAR